MFLILIFSSQAMAEFVPVPRTVTRQAIEFTLSNSADYGIEPDQTFVSLSYSYDSDNLTAFGGFQNTGGLLDLVSDSSYMPFVSETESRIRSMGLGFLHHMQFHSLYTENDFLLTYRCRWNYFSGLSFDFRTGLFYKIADIKSMSENISELGPDFSFHVSKEFQTGTRIYFNWGFHTFFRYPTFGNPSYALGIMQHYKNIAAGLEGEITFTDQIVTVNHIDSAMLKFIWRVEF